MSEAVLDLLKRVEKRTVEERHEFADSLEDLLFQENEFEDEEFIAELQRRADEVLSPDYKGISAVEVFEKSKRLRG